MTDMVCRSANSDRWKRTKWGGKTGGGVKEKEIVCETGWINEEGKEENDPAAMWHMQGGKQKCVCDVTSNKRRRDVGRLIG